jgi:nucleoside-diphosphate-sugar epimerase
MKIIVTGANGFIGRNLVQHLCASHDVFAVVRTPDQALQRNAARSIVMDLEQPIDEKALPVAAAIVHLAQANVPFPESADRLLAVNTISTHQLLKYARRVGVRRFVLASTGDVYGNRVGPSRESDWPAPASFYAVSKRAAEMLANAYSDSIEISVLRLFQPYGPGQSNRLIPRLAERIRQHQAVLLHKEDRPRMTPIFIDDVVIAIVRAIESTDYGTVNIAGDRVCNMRELATETGRVLEIEPIFKQTEQDQGDLIGDNQIMKQIFGTWSMIDLAEGLLRTFDDKEETR